MLLPILLLCGQFLGAMATHGTVGMGITLYQPFCMYSCQGAVSTLYLSCTTFEDDTDMTMDMSMDMGMDDAVMGITSPECYATNTPWLQTLAYCFKQSCAADGVSEETIEIQWSLMSYAAANESYQSNIPTVAPTTELEADATWLNATSLVNQDMYDSYDRTLRNFYFQEVTHVRMGVAMIVCTLAICLLAGAYRAFSMSSRGTLIPNTVSKHLVLPALSNGRHQKPLPFELGYAPSRILSLLITIYVVVNIIFSAVPYKTAQPNVYWTTGRDELVEYIGNRTGVLSFVNIAMAILFAGRNNPLILLTGLSQTTCLTFHRWAARVATIQAIVHSIVYTVRYFWDGGAAEFYTNAAMPYIWWGIIGTVAMSLATVFAILPIRLRAYEFFLISHIVLVILALMGCWYHMDIHFMKMYGYEVWLYIAFAFWGFERLSRVAILGFRNFAATSTKGTAELTTGGEFIKLTVYPARPWKVQPGQHAFLFFPSTGRFWESHPFSIASWSDSTSSAIPTGTSKTASISSLPSDPEKSTHTSTIPIPGSTTSDNQNQTPSITFLIRPHKGITRNLHNKLLSQSTGSSQAISVRLEGPYGHPATLAHADRILLIGGGIGITALLSYIQSYTTARRAGTLKASRLLLAWSFREPGFDNVIRSMLPGDAEALGVELLLRCTGSEDQGERLDVSDIVREEASGCKRLTVLVCAPGGMSDAVRRAVVQNVGKGAKVDLHEDSFAW